MNKIDLFLAGAIAEAVIGATKYMDKEMFMAMIGAIVQAWCENNEGDMREMFLRMSIASFEMMEESASAEDGGEA